MRAVHGISDNDFHTGWQFWNYLQRVFEIPFLVRHLHASAKWVGCFCHPPVGEQEGWKLVKLIGLGAQSFEHANVLSEKINFSALGGPGVAIFGPDDLHPMY